MPVAQLNTWVDTDSQDNAVATATKAAVVGESHFVTHVAGGFSAAVSGETLTLKEGSTTVAVWRVYDTFALVLPEPIKLTAGEVANLELSASGTAGTIGDVTMTGYTA